MVAAKKSINQTNILNDIGSFIIELRNQKVILDSNVAAIYGVETRQINQAVQRNSDKFPQGYILALEPKEWESSKSHFVISMGKETINSSKSQNGTSKGGKVKSPKAFTEKGLYLNTQLKKNIKNAHRTQRNYYP